MYHVLDSTAFYNGISDILNSNIYYTTPEIISEINHLQKDRKCLKCNVDITQLPSNYRYCRSCFYSRNK